MDGLLVSKGRGQQSRASAMKKQMEEEENASALIQQT